MLVSKNFPTWILIGWQQNRLPIRSHVRKIAVDNVFHIFETFKHLYTDKIVADMPLKIQTILLWQECWDIGNGIPI